MHHHPGTFMDTGHSHSLVELRCWGLHQHIGDLDSHGLGDFSWDFCWWFLRGWKLGIPWRFFLGFKQQLVVSTHPKISWALGHFLIGIHPMVGLRFVANFQTRPDLKPPSSFDCCLNLLSRKDIVQESSHLQGTTVLAQTFPAEVWMIHICVCYTLINKRNTRIVRWWNCNSQRRTVLNPAKHW